jgi:hypothetical protein
VTGSRLFARVLAAGMSNLGPGDMPTLPPVFEADLGALGCDKHHGIDFLTPTLRGDCGMPHWPFVTVTCKSFILVCFLTFMASLALPPTAQGQGLELGGGWAYSSGNQGTNGFDIDAAWWFTRHITIAANWDDTWDSTNLGIFTFTQVGAIAVKSHFQNILVGPRIFFPTSWTDKHKLDPFGEAQFEGRSGRRGD